MNLGIIDDDIVTLKVIQESIEKTNFCIKNIFTANNIEQGKYIIINNIIDILICDIEMPMGTGLDLLKWLRDNNYKTEVILLTCHENFNFAKIALQYNAISYVLKPYNPEEMEKELIIAINKINTDKKISVLGDYGNLWIENKNIIKSGFWRDLLFNKFDTEKSILNYEIDKRLLDVSTDKKYNLILITSEISEFSIINNRENQIQEYSVTKYVSKNLKLDTNQMITYYLNNSFAILIVIDQPLYKDFYQRCKILSKGVLNDYEMTLTNYMSDSSLLEELPQKRVILEKLNYNNVSFRGRTLCEDDFDTVKTIDKNIININEISQMLEEQNLNGVLKYCKKILDDLNRRNLLNFDKLNSIQQSILQPVYAYLLSFGIEAIILFSNEEFINLQNSALHSVFELQKWITITFNKTLNYVIEVQKSQSMIGKIKFYIEKNYSYPITRTEVAAQFYLTPEYLAKLFKKEEGISIKNYINNVRLNKAKLLLVQTNLRVSDISLEVGFENFSYFTTLFKKYTGLSPQNYQIKNIIK